MYGEKAWQQLHKNAVSNTEQVVEATSYKAAAVQPPTTITKIIKVRWTRHAGHCWKSKNELISNILLWTPSHGQPKAGQPARTGSVPIQDIALKTSWEWWMIETSGERGSGRSVQAAWHDDDEIWSYCFLQPL